MFKKKIKPLNPTFSKPKLHQNTSCLTQLKKISTQNNIKFVQVIKIIFYLCSGLFFFTKITLMKIYKKKTINFKY